MTMRYSRPKVRTALADKFTVLANVLARPVDASTLATFRLLFGAIMVWEVGRYFSHDYIRQYYIEPRFYFTYELFPFISPFPGQGMFWLFLAMGLFALGIALGLFYKLSSLLFFLTYSYVFLLDKTPYNNHYYLIILLSFLLLVVDAHQWASLDKRREARSSPETIPFWQLFISRAQIFIVYFYGGIAKLNGDWLRGEPMRTWLAEWTHYPVLGPFFATEWAVYFFSYGALLFDLGIGFLVLWPRTRLLAFLGLLFFHLTNNWLFSIGVFPFLALASTILFVEPSGPRQMWQRFGRWLLTSWPGGIKWHSAKVDPVSSVVPVSHVPRPLGVWTNAFIIIYLTLQLLIPLRHWLYAGNVSWTEEGHRFSWHMKLRDKEPRLEIKVIDPKTGHIWNADLREDLTDEKIKKMATRPDMILQYVHHLKEKLQQTGLDQPIILANAWASLNGRPFQRLIDPTVNLAQVQLDPFSPAPWILPLEEKLSHPTEPVLYFLVIVAMILANLGLALSLYFAIGYSGGLKREVSIRIHRFDEGYAATYTLPLVQGQVSGLIKVVSSILPYLTILLCLATWVITSQLIYLGIALAAALLAASWGFYLTAFLRSPFARSYLCGGPALTGILTGLFLLMLIIVAVQG